MAFEAISLDLAPFSHREFEAVRLLRYKLAIFGLPSQILESYYCTLD
jgi:hypothetical protein